LTLDPQDAAVVLHAIDSRRAAIGRRAPAPLAIVEEDAMPATADRHTDRDADAGSDAGWLSAERLVFFSDAVVAIAMTLLALDLPVPDGNTNAKVLSQFGAHRQDYVAFLISFAVVGIQWFGHHRVFGYVVRLGGRLAQWNMLWLLTIVVMPFATRVLTGDGAFQVRLFTYAIVQALSVGFFALMLTTMVRHRLLRPDTPAPVLTAVRRRLAVMGAAFVVSIPVAFVTEWAYACWVAVPFAFGALLRYDRWRHSRPSGQRR
jgi:uncharacterized membrane protein